MTARRSSTANALLVGAGVLLSRLAGFVRERVFAHYLGSSMAADALRAALKRVRGTYEIEISPDLLAGVVSALHDSRFGARHVHRIIEDQILQPLVLEPPGSYRAEFNGNTCTWVAAETDGAA